MNEDNSGKSGVGKALLFSGIGLGSCALGAGISCLITKRIERRKAYDRETKLRRYEYDRGYSNGYDEGYDVCLTEYKNQSDDFVLKAYNKGIDDGLKEAQAWIDKYSVNIDPNDPEGSLAEINEKIKTFNEETGESCEKSDNNDSKIGSESVNQTKNAEKSQKSDKNGSESEKNIAKNGENGAKVPEEVKISERSLNRGYFHGLIFTEEGEDLVFEMKDGSKLRYPKVIFFNRSSGEVLSEVLIRLNLRNFEHNQAHLKKLWDGFGWGEFIPDPENVTNDNIPDNVVITNESLPYEDIDFNRLNLDIDSEVSDIGGHIGDEDEPVEVSEAREGYVKQVKNYIENPENCIQIVSRREFEEDNFLDKINVDYYDGDNVFVESTDMDSEFDATEMFGTNDGKELFSKKIIFPENEDPNDPDVMFIKNFKHNTIAEVTRFKRSYESVRNGSAYFDGGTDQG